jgi:hypothetical protein
VTPSLELCHNATPIVPFTLGTSEKGFKGIVLTHVGSIPGLPSPSNRIYYCKEATCTLYSMGWLISCKNYQHFFYLLLQQWIL